MRLDVAHEAGIGDLGGWRKISFGNEFDGVGANNSSIIALGESAERYWLIAAKLIQWGQQGVCRVIVCARLHRRCGKRPGEQEVVENEG